MVLGLLAAYYLGKNKGVNVTVEIEEPLPIENILAQDWSSFDQDPRSLEELLEKARNRIGKTQ